MQKKEDRYITNMEERAQCYTVLRAIFLASRVAICSSLKNCSFKQMYAEVCICWANQQYIHKV